MSKTGSELDLIDTTEMYLKAIFEVQEEGRTPMRARIAERLDHSGPTVSQTVARMQRDGLLHLDASDRHLEFTSTGRVSATTVMRKHRLAERLLLDVIGLEWPLVHIEACRWEHVMSDRVEAKISAILDDPQRDPYGNPIPSSNDDASPRDLMGSPVIEVLDGLEVGSMRRVRVRRIGEPLQIDADLLTRFQDSGVLPNAEIQVEGSPDGYVLQSAFTMVPDEARHLFVDPLADDA